MQWSDGVDRPAEGIVQVADERATVVSRQRLDSQIDALKREQNDLRLLLAYKADQCKAMRAGV